MTVLLALIAISAPLVGIFRRTVLLNYLFLGILALITAAACVAVIVSVRSARPETGASRGTAIRAVAIIELAFLIIVWATVLATGAIESRSGPSSGRLLLEE